MWTLLSKKPLVDSSLDVGPTPLSARDLTEYMAMLLTDLGCTFVTDAKKKIVRDIKERLTYVALDIEAEMVKSDEDLEKT